MPFFKLSYLNFIIFYYFNFFYWFSQTRMLAGSLVYLSGTIVSRSRRLERGEREVNVFLGLRETVPESLVCTLRYIYNSRSWNLERIIGGNTRAISMRGRYNLMPRCGYWYTYSIWFQYGRFAPDRLAHVPVQTHCTAHAQVCSQSWRGFRGLDVVLLIMSSWKICHARLHSIHNARQSQVTYEYLLLHWYIYLFIINKFSLSKLFFFLLTKCFNFFLV